jgi:uncharacterized membrane protein
MGQRRSQPRTVPDIVRGMQMRNQSEDGMNRVLTRNIDVLRDERLRMVSQSPFSDRVADAITRFTGSMSFVVLHLAIAVGWIVVNTGIVGMAPFDPTFVILATAASVEAIFLSTFVLISQNRATELADRRADLDVQISLLTEHEVTKLVDIVTRIAEKLDVPVDEGELSELKKDVAPEAVLERIEQQERSAKS